MPGEQPFKEFYTPFLKCLREYSVISVRKGIIYDIPGSLLFKMFLVYHNPEQLYNGESRMCIIQLDGCLITEVLPLEFRFVLFAVRLVPTDDVLHGG